MSNQWVISWLVIDYCLWSLGNRWVIDRPQNLQSLITHRLNWLVVDCTDYSSISSRGCKWHFHEAIRKKENTLNVTLMTFSDFIGLNNNIISSGSNCWGRSGWIFSLAPLLNQTLTTLVISWLSLENSSKYPLIRIRFSIFIVMVLSLSCFVIITKLMKTYNQKWKVFVESTALFAYV